jgi:hypothetical protein
MSETVVQEITREFDLCGICRNKGTDECGGCEIPHACLNLFQPDKSKVIINPKVALYAHWVNCIGEKCPEAEAKLKKCRQTFEHVNRNIFTTDLVPIPKDGKCLSPFYLPYSDVDEDSFGFERPQEKGEIIDIPF